MAGWTGRKPKEAPGGPWRALEGKAKAERPLLSAVVFLLFLSFFIFRQALEDFGKNKWGKKKEQPVGCTVLAVSAILYWMCTTCAQWF
jgi:hypothetical protein